MSHRDEAPRQKLTGDDGTETPRVDALIERNFSVLDWASEYQSMKDLARQLERELLSKTKELEEARKDAERYRWLRDGGIKKIGQPATVKLVYDGYHFQIKGNYLDAAIDSALHHDQTAV